MDNALSVFHAQLFDFWYSMGFLPYLGLDDDGSMADRLVRLLRALEQPPPCDSTSAIATAKDLATADWSTKNMMLDCIDKAETLLALERPCSTSLDGRLVEITIAVAARLRSVLAAQAAHDAAAAKQPDVHPLTRRLPNGVLISMCPPLPPPTAAGPPPPLAPGGTRPFNRGLPPGGTALCLPPPPLWTRPEFNSASASSGSVYSSSLQNNLQNSNYTYHYYNGSTNGTTDFPATNTPAARASAAAAAAAAAVPRTLATLNTMHDEYFRGAFDSTSMSADALFDKIRHIAPDATFTYAASLPDDRLQAIVCCVAGWGLGNCAFVLPDGRRDSLAYCKLVNMVMLSGTSLYYTSSPLHKARADRVAQSSPPMPMQTAAPPTMFANCIAPAAPQGPVKPPLFRSVPGAPTSTPGLPPLMPPRPVQPVPLNMHTPPARPPWTNDFFRKPSPTGSVGRPVLYQPPRPYSLPPGSRHCPMPTVSVPRRGIVLPNRNNLPSRRNRKNRDDECEIKTDSSENKREADNKVPVESDSESDSDSYDGSSIDKSSSSESGSDAGSGRDDDSFYGSLGVPCACLYGKARKSKNCRSPRCIYDDMTPEEFAKNKTHAEKARAKRERKRAAKKAAAELAEKGEKSEKSEKSEMNEKSDKDIDKDWDALTNGSSENAVKVVKPGSVCSLPESESESDVEAKPATVVTDGKVDIFAWMKQGKQAEVESEARKAKKEVKRRESFVVV